jgi:hypothetical protein
MMAHGRVETPTAKTVKVWALILQWVQESGLESVLVLVWASIWESGQESAPESVWVWVRVSGPESVRA